MKPLDPTELQTIEAIAEAFARSRARVLEVRAGQSLLRLRRAVAANRRSAEPPAVSAISTTPVIMTPENPTTRVAPATPLEPVRAALVGVFRVLDPPVAVGTVVKARQAIGRVEALGILSDCLAPVAGSVVSIAVQEGQAVEFGQLLFEIAPQAVKPSSEQES